MKINFSFLSVAFFILFSVEKIAAQNLVPNPSFEDTVSCPTSFDEINLSTGWSAFCQSPDYFNSCNDGIVDLPSNIFGYQSARTGNACSGFSAFDVASTSNLRECLGIQLNQQLIIGQKYFVSFFLNRAVKNIQEINVGCNKIGVKFSTVLYSALNSIPIDNTSQVYSDSIISYTLNWIKVSGSFISDSGYNYLSIGNFFSDSLISFIKYDNNAVFAYYYIDDVCVSPDSLECDLNPEGIYNLPQQQIAIYPNPATEQLIITLSSSFFNGVRELPFDNGQLIIKEIEISDALGRVQSCEFKVQRPVTKIDIHSLPSGIYFIKVYFADGSMEVRRFVKE